jgi:hypothetical protein
MADDRSILREISRCLTIWEDGDTTAESTCLALSEIMAANKIEQVR